MNRPYAETRKIDPSRGALLGDGTPNDNDRVETGPTQLAMQEWAAGEVDSTARSVAELRRQIERCDEMLRLEDAELARELRRERDHYQTETDAGEAALSQQQDTNTVLRSNLMSNGPHEFISIVDKVVGEPIDVTLPAGARDASSDFNGRDGRTRDAFLIECYRGVST